FLLTIFPNLDESMWASWYILPAKRGYQSALMEVILQAPKGVIPPHAIMHLADKDPFLVSAALEVLGRSTNTKRLLPHPSSADPVIPGGILLALRRTGDAEAREALPKLLEDPDPGVRRAAIQWVGEERLKEHAERIEKAAAKEPVTKELFEALLAAKDFLS